MTSDLLVIHSQNLPSRVVLIYFHMTYAKVTQGLFCSCLPLAGLMMAFSKHQRWIVSMFDERSTMSWLCWNVIRWAHCFMLFIIHMATKRCYYPLWSTIMWWLHIFGLCANLHWMGWEDMWLRFGNRASTVFNWHLHYSGTCNGGTYGSRPRWVEKNHKIYLKYLISMGLMQERRNPNALAMGLRLSCISPSICTLYSSPRQLLCAVVLSNGSGIYFCHGFVRYAGKIFLVLCSESMKGTEYDLLLWKCCIFCQNSRFCV